MKATARDSRPFTQIAEELTRKPAASEKGEKRAANERREDYAVVARSLFRTSALRFSAC